MDYYEDDINDYEITKIARAFWSVNCADKLVGNLKLFYKSSSSVLPTSCVGHHGGKSIESVVCCLIIHTTRFHALDSQAQNKLKLKHISCLHIYL